MAQTQGVKPIAAPQRGENWQKKAMEPLRGTPSREVRSVDFLPQIVYHSTMTLNIKNADAHRLAKELSALTGETLTEAVTVALREKVERLKADKFDQKKFDRLMRIANDIASRMSPEVKALDIDELLYDSETGLPK